MASSLGNSITARLYPGVTVGPALFPTGDGAVKRLILGGVQSRS